MTHAYLNDLNESALRREILDAGKKLEDVIGGKVEHFSCPGGRYDNRTSAMVREAGYRSMANSRAYANTLATNPYLLGRVAIMRNLDAPTFSLVSAGTNLWKMRMSESCRGAARTILGNSLYDRFRSRLLGQS
jgi:peptidoglycan/xylan/chitin deacetylase (PgdA/CDA1 family)